MTLQQIENQVSNLAPTDLAAFAKWFGTFVAARLDYDNWDMQMIADSQNGKFDKIIAKVDANFEAGKCKPV